MLCGAGSVCVERGGGRTEGRTVNLGRRGGIETRKGRQRGDEKELRIPQSRTRARLASMQSKAGLLGPTWNRRSRGCPRHLWPLLLRLLPLFLLLLLLLLLDEAEVGAAEFGSGGRGDQARLQQHRGQAEEQGAGDAPAEPRHGREPAGHGGILRGCGRRRAPGLRNPAAPARSLPLAPSVVHSLGGRRRSGSAGGWRASGLGIPEHVTAGRGELGLPPPPPPRRRHRAGAPQGDAGAQVFS